MPFEIVRNDIVNMQVDAIVNTANPLPIVGSGTDTAIHTAAGAELLRARENIGEITVGSAAITPGFALKAQYIIHTSGPAWMGGQMGEEMLLRACYDNSLALALEHGCRSVAFPLLSAGNYGFPKPLALQTAISAISSFLMNHEMQIYLVVFNREVFQLSEKLFASVASFIDEHYVDEQMLIEYAAQHRENDRRSEFFSIAGRQANRQKYTKSECMEDTAAYYPAAQPMMAAGSAMDSLEDMLERTDAGFADTLLKLIDKTGRKDSEVYKRANVDRRLFSKIRSNPAYQPSKTTAIAFAIALELSMEETRDFIGRAGFALTNSSKFDIIVTYFIQRKIYDIGVINETLFAFDQSMLGGGYVA